MKRNRFSGTIAAGMAAMVIIFAASCSKDYELGQPDERNTVSSITNKDDQHSIIEMTERVPDIGIYNSTMDKVIIFSGESRYKSFSFSTPNPDWNFSSTTDVAWVESPSGGGILFIGPGALGANTGGTVVAGNSALNINYTFCFSASDDALNLDLGFFDSEFDGVSIVMGIAGDFEQLTTGEFDEDDIFDIFQGFAVYVVYDNEASGEYDILSWLDDLEEDESFLANKGFAYVIAFQQPAGFYFSKNGTLTVSGGQIGFEGTYWGVTFDFSDEYIEFDEANFVEVDGYGEMGCD